MGDAIDKRNLQDQIARSIIKRQFVNYITIEEAERRRLEKEKEEAKKQAAAKSVKKKQRQEDFEKGYNRQTGSYSGQYGQKGELSDITKSQIDQILGEKDEQIRKVVEGRNQVKD